MLTTADICRPLFAIWAPLKDNKKAPRKKKTRRARDWRWLKEKKDEVKI
jgi:hypothetical protein